MMPTRWRKRPVVVDAVQVTDTNGAEIAEWIRREGATGWFIRPGGGTGHLLIETPEGLMRADYGDWIVREPYPTDHRAFYPVKADIFARCFDEALEVAQ